MRKMHWAKGAVLAALIAGSQGCTELRDLRKQNQDLQDKNARQASVITHSQDLIAGLRAEMDRIRGALTDEQRRAASLEESVKKADAEKARFQAELDKLAREVEGVSWKTTAEGPVLVVEDRILFDPGKAELKPAGQAAMKKIADLLKTKPNYVRVDGHTDADPIKASGWDSNHHLSCARSLSVFHQLVKDGIAENRVHVAGFGPNRTVADNKTEAGKKQNRRVEILLMPGAAPAPSAAAAPTPPKPPTPAPAPAAPAPTPAPAPEKKKGT